MADASRTPNFALGDASGVNTALSFMIMMVDTTEEGSRRIHYMQTDFKATGEKTKIESSTRARPAWVRFPRRVMRSTSRSLSRRTGCRRGEPGWRFLWIWEEKDGQNTETEVATTSTAATTSATMSSTSDPCCDYIVFDVGPATTATANRRRQHHHHHHHHHQKGTGIFADPPLGTGRNAPIPTPTLTLTQPTDVETEAELDPTGAPDAAETPAQEEPEIPVETQTSVVFRQSRTEGSRPLVETLAPRRIQRLPVKTQDECCLRSSGW
ncbi:hypothetical protein CISG_07488 [Coccidioides immitis RMSCC 3703]|uniref:Uncharacterized protein n=1 Tax=Coccidioides immitis RMSCC 3703 TaxID=454286 RepID=A0A0J8R004_COCIT|nr:hypothetical protein CISG_07488 [Coccidioides immitis RMSCC 3703]